jgi:hypothetical protein
MPRPPLTVDGAAGPVTWATLFGKDPEPPAAAPSLATAALGLAIGQIGVMEQPAGSNRGPVVDEYVRRVGLNPAGGFPWCAAFVYWSFSEAAKAAGSRNPGSTARLDHWRKATERGIPRVIVARRRRTRPNWCSRFIFIMDRRGVAYRSSRRSRTDSSSQSRATPTTAAHARASACSGAPDESWRASTRASSTTEPDESRFTICDS